MTVDSFRASLSSSAPPTGASLAEQALWWAGNGEWDRAHACAQQGEGERFCDLVHAHLHRVEGDLVNARYWYRRAGRDIPTASLPDEWTAITANVLGP